MIALFNEGLRGGSPDDATPTSQTGLLMSETISVNWNIVNEGHFEFSYPLAAAAPPTASPPESTLEKRLVEPTRKDRVLPLGSSTLAPGLSVLLAR